MNSLKKTVNLAKMCSARYSSQAQPSPKFSIMKEKQSRFQVDDGLPVFLKGGVIDKILYQATIILIMVGMGMTGKLYYDLSFPKK